MWHTSSFSRVYSLLAVVIRPYRKIETVVRCTETVKNDIFSRLQSLLVVTRHINVWFIGADGPEIRLMRRIDRCCCLITANTFVFQRNSQVIQVRANYTQADPSNFFLN